MVEKIKDTADQDVALQATLLSLNKIKITTIALIVTLIIGALILGLNHWSDILSTDRSLSRTELRTQKVTRGDLKKEIVTLGKIVTANSPTLYSSAEGVVTYLVKAGDIVSKGQALLTIDSPTLTNQLQQEKSILNRLKSELEKQKLSSKKALLDIRQSSQLAEITYKTAQRTYERYKLGFEKGFISKSEFERYEDELLLAELRALQAPQNIQLEESIAKTDIENAILQRERQQWIVDELERRNTELKIVSPVDGIVGNIALNQKSAVSLSQSLITVVDLSRYEAEIDVSEHYAPEITPGMVVEIKLDGKNYPGRIIAISPEIIGGQVKLRLDFTGKTPEHLRQNQRISANILLDTHTQVLRLPRGNYLNSDQGKSVFIIKGNKAKKTPITLGSMSEDQVEVISGLNLGDEIIISDTSSYIHSDLIYLTN